MTIQHTVVFRMNADADADHFFSRARELAAIRGVTDFEVLRQVGHKSEFSHGLSMYFDDDAAYDTYLDHPDHLAFVNDVWLPNVADFLELDFVRDRPRPRFRSRLLERLTTLLCPVKLNSTARRCRSGCPS